MSDRWTGRTIDGRYNVESIIGQGGMGVVLKARHKFTGAEFALKMLQPDLQMNDDAKARFLAEARTPTTIGHPGIVQVTDAGVTPEGELYLAMELLTGRTLRQAMYPSLPPQVARRILLELLDALGAAHARGIIHRDLKPENVFLVGPTNTVKLLDFGIAKVVQAGRTAAGMMLGTLSYMAPEQLSDASTVDARADLWAVGVMVYEMLTGKLPFRGTQLGEIMMALASQEPDPIRAYLPEATPAMVAFFATALAKDRTGRFASAPDMAISVSAMLIEGTAPPVVSTLNGLGTSPRSHQMTAADSGPSIPSRQQPAVSAQVSAQPTPFAPHVPPPGSPSAPGSTAAPSAPGVTPHIPPPGSPSAPGVTPHVPPPGSPSAPGFTAPHVPPPGSPSAPGVTPHVPPPGSPSAPGFTAPHVPPPGSPSAPGVTPHAPPPGSPSAPGFTTPSAPGVTAPHGSPSAPGFTAPHGPPSAPFTAPGATPNVTPSAPFTAPGGPGRPGTPNALFTAPPGPRSAGGPYGFVNDAPPPQPGQGYGFVNAAPKPNASGFGMSSWLIIGGAAVGIAILVVVASSMMNDSKGFVRTEVASECPAICEKLAKCPAGTGGNWDNGELCEATCRTSPKFKECYAEAEGVCFVFAACYEGNGPDTGSAAPSF